MTEAHSERATTERKSDAERGQVAISAAEIYESFFLPALFEQWAGPLLDSARVSAGDEVLDVGCGTGVLTAALAEAGARAVGIDASEPYLDGARRRRSHPNIAYQPVDKMPPPHGRHNMFGHIGALRPNMLWR